MSLKKSVSLAVASAAILGVGIARATNDMRIADEGERQRNRKAFLDNECAATGQTCVMGPHGPEGQMQCEYCGRGLAPDAMLVNKDAFDQLFAQDPVVIGGPDFSEIERRSLAHYGEVITKTDAAGNHVVLDIESWDPKAHPFGLPYGGGTLFDGQGDVYAAAAAQIMAPADDEPLPDRLSVNPDSPYYQKRWADVRLGVRFDGSDRPGDVEEYCVSEGWIRVQTFMNNGKPKRERGKIVCLKRHGRVEPYRK